MIPSKQWWCLMCVSCQFSWVVWKMLMRKGGQAEIDEFIAHHVIPGSMTYDQFKSEPGHVCLSGESMTVDTRGGITFNGAHVRSGHVMTQHGSVIGMDDIVHLPLSVRWRFASCIATCNGILQIRVLQSWPSRLHHQQLHHHEQPYLFSTMAKTPSKGAKKAAKAPKKKKNKSKSKKSKGKK